MNIESFPYRLKQPEYTGKNRCFACTVVNCLIAAVLSIAIAAGGYLIASPVTALLAGGVTLAASLVTIYLKGYLVPGTPTLTKRYFPMWLLERFGKAPSTPDDLDEPESTDGLLDPEAVLLSTGALEEAPAGDDLRVAADFERAWAEEMRTVDPEDGGREGLLEVLDAGADVEIEFEEHGDAFRATAEGYEVGTWESEAAFEADVAAGRVLDDRLEQWEEFSSFERGEVLKALRLFLEQCPACGGPVSLQRETVESCCSEHEVVASTCDDCGDRLFESALREDPSDL